MKKNIRKPNYKQVICLMAIIIVLALQFIILPKTAGYIVSIKGQDVGYVDNKEMLLDIIDSLEKNLSIKYGSKTMINQDIIKYESSKVLGKEYVDETSLYNALTQSDKAYLKAWAVVVNGEKVVTLNNKQKAEQLLEDAKKQYLKQGSEYLNVGTKEKIQIKSINASSNELMDYDKALTYLSTGMKEKKKYTVKNGESYWTIAQKFGLSVEELALANPDTKSEAIQIGQTINLLVLNPYITVQTVEKAIVSEKIPYDIEYEKTNTLYEGEEKIKLEGVYGVKETITKVTRENGKEIDTKSLESEIKKEAEKQIVLIGTKPIPNSLGTGALDSPTRGTVTSPFGNRWGRMHTGVDIANNRGTAIVAADGGIVSFAGYKGDYGWAVIISHGNNKTTLYGHCQELLVKQGEKVEKGKIIAKMGDTGRVTGVHLHFEVRMNNVPQDPSKYIELNIN